MRPLKGLFPRGQHQDILVGLGETDDAAVWRVSDDLVTIHTVDFFPPVVDDPFHFGAIAAANALSDVYAMGGEVVLALNICTFPQDLPAETVAEILRGGAEKVREAGGVIAGGHTIDGDVPSFGLAVVGVAHPRDLRTKAAARPGDAVVLTKPLGVGLVTTALKADVADPEHVEAAVGSMLQLNRHASRLLRRRCHSLTDVTGFGLLGHASELAEASGVGLRLRFGHLPWLPGAHAYAAQDLFPGGACRNEAYFGPRVTFEGRFSPEERMLPFCPETSGGLLASVPPDLLAEVAEDFDAAGLMLWVVGEVVEGEGIVVTR